MEAAGMMAPHASLVVTLGIPALALVVLAVALAGVRRVAPARTLPALLVMAAWLALWGALAGAGLLANFTSRPPPVAILFVAVIVAGVGVGLSPLGGQLARTLPLWTLVALQAFRLPLELVMARAADEGVMPVELSLHGYNFDVLTGLSAIVVAAALARGAHRAVAWAFSALGLTLLSTILVLALLTSPLVHHFGTARMNTWIAYFPFVYLPTVLVTTALAGHVILVRALILRGRQRA